MTWQLLKGVDSRPVANFGRAPNLGDMRDTGGVQEHASDVIGLYRDEVYNPDSMYKGTMRLLALKRRDDQGNTFVDLGFDPVHQRFYAAELRRESIDVF
jgi:replicative DNA helicase